MHPLDIGKPQAKSKPKFTRSSNSNIFEEVKAAAAGQIESLASRWLPGKTKRSGDNLMALNPTRADKKIGSFSINVRTGVWADFATDDKGGDIISFYAYLHNVKQIEAARELADLLGVRT